MAIKFTEADTKVGTVKCIVRTKVHFILFARLTSFQTICITDFLVGYIFCVYKKMNDILNGPPYARKLYKSILVVHMTNPE